MLAVDAGRKCLAWREKRRGAWRVLPWAHLLLPVPTADGLQSVVQSKVLSNQEMIRMSVHGSKRDREKRTHLDVVHESFPADLPLLKRTQYDFL